MKQACSSALGLLLLAACNRLPTLTPQILEQAEQKWSARQPHGYDLVVEMSGDRVETGRFEVKVRSGQVVGFSRNGLALQPDRGRDYSIEGLFHILEEELGLVEKPVMLGAPEGYSVYITARFDDATGRLIHYRRVVGGTSNSIDINVVGYETHL